MAAAEQEAEFRALLSVYDKTGIEGFAEGLHDMGWEIMASGGTARAIGEAGVPVTDVADFVGGEAILGHRVVTLSREVHAGLLADLSDPEQVAELKQHGIRPIHLVGVDMYPLEETMAKPNVTASEILEATDIGGPTMLRAGAKGRRIVLSSADQRQAVLEWLQAGRPDEDEFLHELAARAEYEVARYTTLSAVALGGPAVSGTIERLHTPLGKGENGWQSPAGIFSDTRHNIDPLSVADGFTHVQGMEMGGVNATDIDRLLQTTTHIAAGFDRNWGEVPAIAVAVKHGNACGAGVGETLPEAIKKMIDGDTRAIFGGFVMMNGEIDAEIAELLMQHSHDGSGNRLLDGIIGSSVTPEAQEILTRKKLRIVVNPALAQLSEESLDTTPRRRQVRGGTIVQPNYTRVHDFGEEGLTFVGHVTEQDKQDMVLAWAVGSTSNSNTITLVKDGMVLANGVGQQDRVGAGELALKRASDMGHDVKGAIAYSDSFFPFPDGPTVLAKAGIKAILTSSGSVGDMSVIEAMQEQGVALVMVPDGAGRGFFGH